MAPYSDCKIQLKCHPADNVAETGEYVEVQIWGNRKVIVETLEQLSWVASLFRKTQADQLAVSDVSFWAGILGIPDESDSKLATPKAHFEMSLFPVELSLQAAPTRPGPISRSGDVILRWYFFHGQNRYEDMVTFILDHKSAGFFSNRV